jgi:hypothetical protein
MESPTNIIEPVADGFFGAVEHYLVIAIAVAILTATGTLIRWLAGRIGSAAGEWSADFTLDGVEHEEHIHCRQFFGWIRGTSRLSWVDPAAPTGRRQKVRKYKFRGVHTGDGLRAHYRATSAPTPDFGVFMMRKVVIDDHVRYVGMYSGLKLGSDDPIEIVENYEWRRSTDPLP